jgi:hypothetical protein
MLEFAHLSIGCCTLSLGPSPSAADTRIVWSDLHTSIILNRPAAA